MKNLLWNSEKFLPPNFMATTRLKILFKEQYLPHSFFEIQHPKAMFALQYITNFAERMINFYDK